MKAKIQIPYDVLVEIYIFSTNSIDLKETKQAILNNGTLKTYEWIQEHSNDLEYIYNHIDELKNDFDKKMTLDLTRKMDNGERVNDFFKTKFDLKSDSFAGQLQEIEDMNLKVKVKQEFSDVKQVSKNLFLVQSDILINTNYESPLDEYIRLNNELEKLEQHKIKEALKKGIDVHEIYERLDELETFPDVLDYLDSDFGDDYYE